MSKSKILVEAESWVSFFKIQSAHVEGKIEHDGGVLYLSSYHAGHCLLILLLHPSLYASIDPPSKLV